MVIIKRVCSGLFEVYKDDIKTTYSIINGCLGSSGNDANMYGIINGETSKTIWIGSLQKCKRTVAHWLTK